MKRISGNGKLFEKIQIGTMIVPNRFVAAPFCSRLATPEGYATLEVIDYWKQRAAGGCGLVIVEATYIDRKASRIERNQLGVWNDEFKVGLGKIAEAIKIEGSKAVLQLLHAGRQTLPSEIWGLTPIAPSPIPCKYMSALLGKTQEVKEITLKEIEEVIEAFANGARRAKEAGFDAVELHFAHGYLVTSFLSPYTNKRNDNYGGSLQNRARIALEILTRVKQETGQDFPVGVRISAEEFMPEGICIEETKIVSCWLLDNGIDYLHISASNYETAETQCTPTYLPKGYLVPLAEEVKNVVPSLPIIVGGAISPEIAIQVIEENKADLVSFGRGLNADPALPNKMAEGRIEDILRCIRCNRCLEAVDSGRPPYCDINFLSTRNLSYPLIKLNSPRKVIVVGGGPSGLESARVAALRGCNVDLYEKTEYLGGALIAASRPKFSTDILNLVKYYERKLDQLGVRVLIKQQADSNFVKELKPDTVIVALGSEPLPLNIKGGDSSKVIQASKLLRDNIQIGDNLVVLGGGFISCQVSAYLAQEGKKVTIVTARKKLEQIAGEIDAVSQKVLLRLLNELKITIYMGLIPQEVTDQGLICKNHEDYIFLPSENVIVSMGFFPKKKEALTFKNSASRVFIIGDCVRPRWIGPAIHDGFIAGYRA